MPVTTYYLEMNSLSELKESPDPGGLVITELAGRDIEFCKMLYKVIGGQWHWFDRYEWDDGKWRAYLDDPGLTVWVARKDNELAGFYELHMQEDGNVEVALLGLTPDFIGKGLGGYLLTHALKAAWKLPDTKRVWLHTCSLDHDNAVRNYEARGMRLYKTDIDE